jgi:excisionase family DNA binding protein
MKNEEKFISSLDLAKRLDCSRMQVYRLVAKGMPSYRSGHSSEHRFLWSEVKNWLRKGDKNAA